MYSRPAISPSPNPDHTVSLRLTALEDNLNNYWSRHLAINACLAPIISVDGKAIITVEGLGNSENPHPLQERLWKMSGSQCGFCTPGIVMSIYAILRNAMYRGELTVADVELEGALDGNLCRCTGYKTILDAAKTFVGQYLSGESRNSFIRHIRYSLLSTLVNKNSDEFIVPINFAAANMDDGEVATSGYCLKSLPLDEISADRKILIFVRYNI